MKPLLDVCDLRVTFTLPEGELEAVCGVSFSVPEGRCVALVGESGSGKSVIGQSIMGLLPPPAAITGGRIIFRGDAHAEGCDLATLSSAAHRSLRAHKLALIFQEPMTALSPVHSLGNQVGEALACRQRLGRADLAARVVQILHRVGFPDPHKAVRCYPFELSGGLRQRAVIAMALISAPALVIADEPTTALDVTMQALILDLLKRLRRELGMTLLLITHDLGVVANLADEVVVLYRGCVMERGATARIFSRPGHAYLKALLAAVPRSDRPLPPRAQRPATAQAAALNLEIPASALGPASTLGASPQALPQAEASRPLEPLILRVQDVHKSFTLRNSGGGLFARKQVHQAVQGVSFSLKRGQCFGLVGESGCGKTTLCKTIMRAILPDQGRLLFTGRDHQQLDVFALDKSDLQSYRRRVQFVFQDPFSSLNPRQTVLETLMEPLAIHGLGDRAWRQERARMLMKAVGLDHRHLGRYPHSFSGGQRQRIGIARALALGPELLICDEPVSALDVLVQAQILDLLRELRQTLALSYLFISHNLAVVHQLADDIGVMCAGRLVELGSRAQIFTAPRHPYTRALLAAAPVPDPDCPLDIATILKTRAQEAQDWPAPFNLSAQPQLVDCGGGHQVLMAS